MISAYGGIRWGTGMLRAFQYEKTQSRIGAPPWDAPLQFIENSPIFWVERINTPYLSIHNDADDAVPWYQGIEFNTAMRRLGKEAYMFNYNGEPHGLRNRDNMKHWTVHMDEFFDHYLLGKPRRSGWTRACRTSSAARATSADVQAAGRHAGADARRPGSDEPGSNESDEVRTPTSITRSDRRSRCRRLRALRRIRPASISRPAWT